MTAVSYSARGASVTAPVPGSLQEVEPMLSDRRVHATLPTQDVDRLRTFYEEILVSKLAQVGLS